MVALAALLVVSFTIPAWAMESQFGGYWRTRMWTSQNFTGEDRTEGQDYNGDGKLDNADVSAVDTRTRLYYTAVFHENLKFVNKFEFNSYWGDTNGGDIGADGMGYFRIKNSYADFNMGAVNAKIGIQGAALARGFLFDDDFSGAVISFNGGGISIPLIWMKAYEGGWGKDQNDFDVDYYGIAPVFNAGDNIKINPFALYAYSKDASAWAPTSSIGGVATEELNLWYAGLNFDANFDMFSLWATGIYQGGDLDMVNNTSYDFSAWLAAVGFGMDMNWGGVHGQFFYATGDDTADSDLETFWVPKGQSYYWAEIMGLGKLGDVSFAQVSRNAPGDQIGNIMAGNFGVTVKPADKLKINLDVWYAAKAEDITTLKGNTESYLGTEVDLCITYQLVQGLNLDIIGAYLFAGDATTMEDPDEADPYEIGTRLSLSF